MDNPQMISVLALACAGLSIAASLACFALTLKARQQRRNFLALALQMERELSATSQDTTSAAQRASDLARRIALLEGRSRFTKAEATDAPDAAFISAAKTPITERRHRVLSLARRGQDTGEIANLLGLTRGEVELIIGLSQAA